MTSSPNKFVVFLSSIVSSLFMKPFSSDTNDNRASEDAFVVSYFTVEALKSTRELSPRDQQQGGFGSGWK